MVRRTKQEALATRHGLLDAAEMLFQEKGVSSTSLNDIARRAGTTRGAIYWHFKDKADLFNAMMERITFPLEQTLNSPDQDPDNDPLAYLRKALHQVLRQISTDPQTRRVFEIATQKAEYIDELQAVWTRQRNVRNNFLAYMENCLHLAATMQKVTTTIPVSEGVHGLHAIVDGLLQNWLLDTDAFDLSATGEKVIDVYLKGLGFMTEDH